MTYIHTSKDTDPRTPFPLPTRTRADQSQARIPSYDKFTDKQRAERLVGIRSRHDVAQGRQGAL